MTKPMCGHRPISNGWSTGTSVPPTTWCGHCRDRVLLDEAWVSKFYDRHRDKRKRAGAGTWELANIEADREHLLAEVRKHAAVIPMTADTRSNLKTATIRHNGGIHTYTGPTLAAIVREQFGPQARVGTRRTAAGELAVLVTRGGDQLIVGSIVGVTP